MTLNDNKTFISFPTICIKVISYHIYLYIYIYIYIWKAEISFTDFWNPVLPVQVSDSVLTGIGN